MGKFGKRCWKRLSGRLRTFQNTFFGSIMFWMLECFFVSITTNGCERQENHYARFGCRSYVFHDDDFCCLDMADRLKAFLWTINAHLWSGGGVASSGPDCLCVKLIAAAGPFFLQTMNIRGVIRGGIRALSTRQLPSRRVGGWWKSRRWTSGAKSSLIWSSRALRYLTAWKQPNAPPTNWHLRLKNRGASSARKNAPVCHRFFLCCAQYAIFSILQKTRASGFMEPSVMTLPSSSNPSNSESNGLKTSVIWCFTCLIPFSLLTIIRRAHG